MATIRRLTSVRNIRDPYSRRILANVIGRDVMKTYAATPNILRRLTSGLSEKQMRTRPAAGKWPIAFVLSHLCDAELAVSYRLRMVMSQPGCQILAYDQDRWASNLLYDKSDFRKSLALFTALRESNLAILRRARPIEMHRYGIHEERGKETVERLIQMIAGHDINHLKQIRKMRGALTGRQRA
jgi:hypothetical protein